MKTTELTVSRLIPASPEEVYDVWIDPKSPGGPWYGAERVIVDVKVDGLFFLAVSHEGSYYPHYGRFIALERARKVEYTWVSVSTQGLESIVEVRFAPKDGKTEVTLRHSNVPDDDKGREHAAGWGYVLGCLADRFATPS